VDRSNRLPLPLLLLSLAVAALLTACNGRPDITPRRDTVTGLTPAEADARAEQVRHDPVAYVRKVAANCRQLRQYTLTFVRHERRGLFQRLYGPEHIRCWFRQKPFSVRMKWLDEDLKYGESVYVQGQAGNKVRFVTRWWVPGLKAPPGVNVVDLGTPVAWGESKRPLSDFGLQRMMDKSLAALDQDAKDVAVTYNGLVQMPGDGRTAHFVRLEYPASRYAVPIQELYVDVATDLPAGTVLRNAAGRIDAAYYYTELDVRVTLTDDDFVLEGERGGPR